MNKSPIRKLNKKLIHICLMVAALIAVPMMIIPMAGNATKHKENTERPATQAMVFGNDAFMLSGTDKFPASYDAVKQFEKEKALEKIPPSTPPEDIAASFAKLSNIDREPAAPTLKLMGENSPNKDDPWLQAQKQEQNRRAFEHYDARRSDIIFTRNKMQPTATRDPADPMVGMLEKTLALAQKQMNPSPANTVFFPRSNQNNVGQLKDPQPYMLSEGTLIPAVLLNEINTDLPGPILARVTHNIWDSKTGQTLVLPQNSKLMGKYQSNIGHGQERAQIVWTRIIYPNQQSLTLGAMAGLDKRGVSGTTGHVNNHYDQVGLGLLMTTALGAGVRLTQGHYDPNSASIAQEFGNSLAQETMRLGNKVADKMLAIKPTIVVPTGKRLNVFVEQDLSLRPYEG